LDENNKQILSDMKNFNLQRFTDAQKGVYSVALAEIGNGRKVGHWIWHIFLQLVGMGYSYNSQYYGIEKY
jgi:uncharacterized protein (DUF1810 family)